MNAIVVPLEARRYGLYQDGRLLAVWPSREQALSFCYPGWGRYVRPIGGSGRRRGRRGRRFANDR